MKEILNIFEIWIRNWPSSYNVDPILWSYYVLNLLYSNEIDQTP